MPDRWPYSTLTRAAFVLIFVTFLGLAVPLASKNWIAWLLWAVSAIALVFCLVTLTILRARLDKAAVEEGRDFRRRTSDGA